MRPALRAILLGGPGSSIVQPQLLLWQGHFDSFALEYLMDFEENVTLYGPLAGEVLELYIVHVE